MSQAEFVSPKFCKDCVSGRSRVPRVLRGCITHVATCVLLGIDGLAKIPSHLPDLSTQVVS
ncbi:unnamed protein product [Prunus armeniaca]